ncbi:MAG: YbaN family protein [Sneathiella sp.]|nr:YbaN family protein [Sneathiella sp.]
MKLKSKKLILLAIGWLFVAVGAVGIVLPVLPTTPFLLISLWAFSQSSDRFHDWLYTHRVFGPPLQDWSNHGVIPLKAKVIAITSMATSATLVILLSKIPWYGLVGMLALMSVGAIFVLTRPSRRRASE